MAQRHEGSPNEEPRTVHAGHAVDDYSVVGTNELCHTGPMLVDRAWLFDPRDVVDRIGDVRLVDHSVSSVESAQVEDRVEALVEQLDRREGRIRLEQAGDDFAVGLGGLSVLVERHIIDHRLTGPWVDHDPEMSDPIATVTHVTSRGR